MGGRPWRDGDGDEGGQGEGGCSGQRSGRDKNYGEHHQSGDIASDNDHQGWGISSGDVEAVERVINEVILDSLDHGCDIRRSRTQEEQVRYACGIWALETKRDLERAQGWGELERLGGGPEGDGLKVSWQPWFGTGSTSGGTIGIVRVSIGPASGDTIGIIGVSVRWWKM